MSQIIIAVDGDEGDDDQDNDNDDAKSCNSLSRICAIPGTHVDRYDEDNDTSCVVGNDELASVSLLLLLSVED